MGRVIVIEFTALDGVIEDPDGKEGFRHGGWAFRYGPAEVAGDKFALGEILRTGALLLGRRTWQRFAAIWPSRDDAFSRAMNAMPKFVVSRTLEDASEWKNSEILQGDLADRRGHQTVRRRHSAYRPEPCVGRTPSARPSGSFTAAQRLASGRPLRARACTGWGNGPGGTVDVPECRWPGLV
jgi:hypothetical protein